MHALGRNDDTEERTLALRVVREAPGHIALPLERHTDPRAHAFRQGILEPRPEVEAALVGHEATGKRAAAAGESGAGPTAAERDAAVVALLGALGHP